MIGGQDEDSRGKRSSCTQINCGVTSGSAHASHLFVFRLNRCSYVLISFYL
ncbi:hypothetical protein [Priestia megaterium]|uniref:hypothetical protein n=1 Tax=Priestia megaterium TaxID=1404 RepID=UPI001C3F48FB|nr:hypothetical protein [Priestia megaterium]MED4734038.1 hypothetical protein [Priestia megaterium]